MFLVFTVQQFGQPMKGSNSMVTFEGVKDVFLRYKKFSRKGPWVELYFLATNFFVTPADSSE